MAMIGDGAIVLLAVAATTISIAAALIAVTSTAVFALWALLRGFGKAFKCAANEFVARQFLDGFDLFEIARCCQHVCVA